MDPMNHLQLLTWARGTGLNLALTILLLGIIWRLIEIYALGRKKDLSAPRDVAGASGWHTIFRRSVPPPGMFKTSPVSYIGGYVFHVGLAIVVFLFAPHIALIKDLFGLSWPGLPSQVVDFTSVVAMAAMVVVLFDRINKPVKRFLSTFGDWFTWTLTFLPLLTGWMAVHHLLLPYTLMLALHILSVELLLICLPFTKLFHAFTVFGSRWFNGTVNGHKGVPV
jgi:nitrate reductase gamma subunit